MSGRQWSKGLNGRSVDALRQIEQIALSAEADSDPMNQLLGEGLGHALDWLQMGLERLEQRLGELEITDDPESFGPTLTDDESGNASSIEDGICLALWTIRREIEQGGEICRIDGSPGTMKSMSWKP